MSDSSKSSRPKRKRATSTSSQSKSVKNGKKNNSKKSNDEDLSDETILKEWRPPMLMWAKYQGWWWPCRELTVLEEPPKAVLDARKPNTKLIRHFAGDSHEWKKPNDLRLFIQPTVNEDSTAALTRPDNCAIHDRLINQPDDPKFPSNQRAMMRQAINAALEYDTNPPEEALQIAEAYIERVKMVRDGQPLPKVRFQSTPNYTKRFSQKNSQRSRKSKSSKANKTVTTNVSPKKPRVRMCHKCKLAARGQTIWVCQNCNSHFHENCVKIEDRKDPTIVASNWYCSDCTQLQIDRDTRSQVVKAIKPRVCGLVNIGNTCYINAAVQLMNAIFEFSSRVDECLSNDGVERFAKICHPNEAIRRRGRSHGGMTGGGGAEYEQWSSLIKQSEQTALLDKANDVSNDNNEAFVPETDSNDDTNTDDKPSTTSNAVDNDANEKNVAADQTNTSTATTTTTTDVAKQSNGTKEQEKEEEEEEEEEEEQEELSADQTFVDSLIGVLRCMDPARKSCLFSQLVRLKEQSAKVLSPKYFSDRHQDMYEYLMQALDHVHEATTVPTALLPSLNNHMSVDASQHTPALTANNNSSTANGHTSTTDLSPRLRRNLRSLQKTVNGFYIDVPPTQPTLIECPPPEQQPESANERRNKAWQKYKHSNRSVVSDVFDGLITRARRCPQGHMSFSDEPFRVLTLGFAMEEKSNKGKVSLEDLFALFFNTEQLEKRCDDCEDKSINQLFDQTSSITHYPNILVLHLNRFRTAGADDENWWANKVKKEVIFPLHMTFNDAAFKEQERPVYDLIAVVNHKGEYSSGHYFTYILNPANDPKDGAEWFKFDDATVSTISKTAIQSPYAYMLVYRLSV